MEILVVDVMSALSPVWDYVILKVLVLKAQIKTDPTELFLSINNLCVTQDNQQAFSSCSPILLNRMQASLWPISTKLSATHTK